MKQFEWVDMTDFTGGLYTVADFLIPPNGAKEMLDCHPIAGGGIRAFFKPESKTVSGLPTSDHVALALFTRAITIQGSSGERPDTYILTRRVSDNTSRLYRLDEAASTPSTTWANVRTWAVGSGSGYSTFQPFTLSSGTTKVYVNLNALGNVDGGIWGFTQAAGVAPTFNQVATYIGFLTMHQSRLLTGSVEQNSSRIRWSDVGSETFGSSSFLDVEPPRDGNIWGHPFAPQDLLVGKGGSYYYLVQGDITEPIVRQESGVNIAGRGFTPGETEEGLAVFSQNQGMFFTPNGVSWQHASPQLEPEDVTVQLSDDFGHPRYFGGYLFLPSGLVRYRDTGSWFRLSEWSKTAPAAGMAFDRNRDNWALWAVKKDLTAVYKYLPSDQTTQRKSTYTWQSAPMRHPTGRQLVIREVQIVLNAFASGASCAVTVGATTRTATGIASGRQKVSFLFNEFDEVLDITVVPNSNNSSVEAPIIEAIRVGTLAGHQTV